MNELFTGLQTWFNNLPEAQANFLTSGLIVMLVVGFVVKFMLKGVVKVIAMIVIALISFFWATGYPIPILSDYFSL